ncbi:MAG: MAPEG family protein, partial [Betaproteobacteria bacterium]
MKPEMILLLWAVALAFAQVLVAVTGALLQVGLPALAGNRDKFPELTGWAGRAKRAHHNMMESLPLFIALVFIGVAIQKSNQMTVLGA